MKFKYSYICKLIVMPLLLIQCSPDCDNKKYIAHESLNSTLWVQTSVEYEMICRQTFLSATHVVEKAVLDKSWSAAIEQMGSMNFSDLPPAIIVDVDETILDNSPFQARLIRNNKVYNDTLWKKWVMEEKAHPVPGAKEFIHDVKKLGIKVFYVTNRQEKVPTVKNLQKMIDSTIAFSEVLVKNEKPAWTSDKTTRRSYIANSHRILVLVGDDYNDFAFLGKVLPEKRIERAVSHKKFWGTKWFILPNPTYGNFDKALWNYDYSIKGNKKVGYKYSFLKTDEY
jgi:acid phosphatase